MALGGTDVLPVRYCDRMELTSNDLARAGALGMDDAENENDSGTPLMPQSCGQR
jgi:hypothetical protein